MERTVALPSQSERYVRVAVAAARLDVHPNTLKAQIKSGELRGFRFGERGHWRISEASLQDAIERSRP